jgi:hypothetical protein
MTPSTSTALVLDTLTDAAVTGVGAGAGACFSSTELHANAKTAANEIPAGQDAYLIELPISNPPRILPASIAHRCLLGAKNNFSSLNHTSL